MEGSFVDCGSRDCDIELNTDCLDQEPRQQDDIFVGEEESRHQDDIFVEEEESRQQDDIFVEEEESRQQDDIFVEEEESRQQDDIFVEEEEFSSENSISVTNSLDEDNVSDNESTFSCVSNSEKKYPLFGSGFVRLDESHELYGDIENRFLSDLANRGLNTQVVAIHKNTCSSFNGQTKLRSFEIYLKAHEATGHGNANLKQGWFTASKAQISTILTRGFFEATENGIYGRGIYLSPLNSTLDCLQSAVVDEDGMRHMMLCRVIMGRMEVVHPGSRQYCPSSEDYDSGVDDLLCPKKYIIWGCHMNSHILPVLVISFKAPNQTTAGNLKVSAPWKKPTSPWIPIPVLISALSQFLPKDAIKLLQQHHDSLKEKKITREEVVKKFRDIAGDRLLVSVIKSYRNRMHGSKDCPPNKYMEQHRGDGNKRNEKRNEK